MAYLGLREVCAARSREEYFWEGPKMRVPPCSLPPFAGAHVGRAAVVISRLLFRRAGLGAWKP